MFEILEMTLSLPPNSRLLQLAGYSAAACSRGKRDTEPWPWKNISDLEKGTFDLGIGAVLNPLAFKEKINIDKPPMSDTRTKLLPGGIFSSVDQHPF